MESEFSLEREVLYRVHNPLVQTAVIPVTKQFCEKFAQLVGTTTERLKLDRVVLQNEVDHEHYRDGGDWVLHAYAVSFMVPEVDPSWKVGVSNKCEYAIVIQQSGRGRYAPESLAQALVMTRQLVAVNATPSMGYVFPINEIHRSCCRVTRSCRGLVELMLRLHAQDQRVVVIDWYSAFSSMRTKTLTLPDVPIVSLRTPDAWPLDYDETGAVEDDNAFITSLQTTITEQFVNERGTISKFAAAVTSAIQKEHLTTPDDLLTYLMQLCSNHKRVSFSGSIQDELVDDELIFSVIRQLGYVSWKGNTSTSTQSNEIRLYHRVLSTRQCDQLLRGVFIGMRKAFTIDHDCLRLMDLLPAEAIVEWISTSTETPDPAVLNKIKISNPAVALMLT